jgi:hypothetical protein
MRPAVTRLALALWLISMGLVVAAVIVSPHLLPVYGLLPPLLSFATVGAFLAARRPGNPVGWLFAAWGAVMAFSVFVDAYVDRGLVRDPVRFPRPTGSPGQAPSSGIPPSRCWSSCCCCSPTAACPRGAGGRWRG